MCIQSILRADNIINTITLEYNKGSRSAPTIDATRNSVTGVQDLPSELVSVANHTQCNGISISIKVYLMKIRPLQTVHSGTPIWSFLDSAKYSDKEDQVCSKAFTNFRDWLSACALWLGDFELIQRIEGTRRARCSCSFYLVLYLVPLKLNSLF